MFHTMFDYKRKEKLQNLLKAGKLKNKRWCLSWDAFDYIISIALVIAATFVSIRTLSLILLYFK